MFAQKLCSGLAFTYLLLYGRNAGVLNVTSMRRHSVYVIPPNKAKAFSLYQGIWTKTALYFPAMLVSRYNLHTTISIFSFNLARKWHKDKAT